MNRFNIVLLVMAALQIGLLLSLHFFSGESGTTTRDPVDLLDFESKKVGSLKISRKDGQDDGEVHFERREDQWVVAGTGGYPADATKIEKALTTIAGIQVARPLIRKKSNHEPIKVADGVYERKISLSVEGASDPLTFFASRGSRAQAVYLRRAGEDEVYESEGLSLFELSSNIGNWISSEPYAVDPDAVETLAFRVGADGPEFEFARGHSEGESGKSEEAPKEGEAKHWRMTKPEAFDAETSRVEDILEAFTKVSVEGCYGKTAPSGLDEKAPEAHATLTLKGGKTIDFIIGKEDADALRPIKSSESDFFVKVSNWSLESLLQAKPQDFKEKEEHSEEDH